jgi:hypothetical protein
MRNTTSAVRLEKLKSILTCCKEQALGFDSPPLKQRNYPAFKAHTGRLSWCTMH